MLQATLISQSPDTDRSIHKSDSHWHSLRIHIDMLPPSRSRILDSQLCHEQTHARVKRFNKKEV